MKFLETHFFTRLKALINSGAWLLIVIGLLLFSMNIPLSNTGWINWPVAATVFQTGGLVFMLCGFTIIASIVVWPQIKVGDLLVLIRDGNVAAALVVLGLLIFDGLIIIAFVLWLAGALGAGVTAK